MLVQLKIVGGQKMKKTSILVCAIFFIFAAASSQDTFASGYTRAFIEYHGTSSVATARSPFRQEQPVNPSIDRFPKITSNNNQPRNVDSGTNPHNATDFDGRDGERVYPLFKAKVISVNTETSGQLGHVLLQFDIDNNGTFDDYYAKYLHVVPKPGISVGDVFTSNEYIATIDSRKQWGPHLDLKDTNFHDNRSIKLYRYFRWISEWNMGSYLEYFSGDAMVGNTLYITGVSSRIASYDALQHVELYYRVGSTGTFQKASTNFSEVYPSINRYGIDLKEATGAQTGEHVLYYLAGVRSDISGYDHGLFPQYYRQPAKVVPNQHVGSFSRMFTIQ